MSQLKPLKNTAENLDFRVRVAREKRERMRIRLLDATLNVYSPDQKGRAAVIDDVVKMAGVSRGTFYKYFDSLEEAVTELGQTLTDEMIRSYQQLFGDVADTAAKAAGGTLLTLARAAMEPRWGFFAASVDFIQQFSDQAPMYTIVTATLIEARQENLVHFNNTEAATDMVVGAAIEASKRLAHGQHRDKSYITEIATLCMTGLGMSPAKAVSAVDNAWKIINNHSIQLGWWHELPAGENNQAS